VLAKKKSYYTTEPQTVTVKERVSLTEVSPDRRHGLTLGQAVHTKAAVPISTTEQKLGIMGHNKQMTAERKTGVEWARQLSSSPAKQQRC